VTRAPSLRRLVERHAVSFFERLGFAYAPEVLVLTFRRIAGSGRTVQVAHIVEFQRGVKNGSFGTFVVNLGVYSPQLTQPPRGVKALLAHSSDCMVEMSTRLAHLAPPCPVGAMVSFVTGEQHRQPDVWWSYRGAPSDLDATFRAVLALFRDRGEPWLAVMSSPERFRWALQIRTARVAAQGGAPD
jgi:hypothetical protein